MNIKHFFRFFISFLFLSVVDDSGAGSDDDIGDFDIDDDIGDDKVDDDASTKEQESKASQDRELALLKRIEELEAHKQLEENNKAFNYEVEVLTKKYSDFDVDKIAEELRIIAKEQGKDKAEYFNNPIGWENIYLTRLRKETPSNNPQYFDRGRGHSEGAFDFKKHYKLAVEDGNNDSMAELFRHSK